MATMRVTLKVPKIEFMLFGGIIWNGPGGETSCH
jgi:hypothetical protein